VLAESGAGQLQSQTVASGAPKRPFHRLAGEKGSLALSAVGPCPNREAGNRLTAWQCGQARYSVSLMGCSCSGIWNAVPQAGGFGSGHLGPGGASGA
jgi:hypothetical protein